MHRYSFIFQVVLFFGCLFGGCLFGIPAQANPFLFLEPYRELLQKHTAQTEQDGIQATVVNYHQWGADPQHTHAMHLLQTANPSELRAVSEKIAFWANAYNLFTVDLIIKTEEANSIRNLGSLLATPWQHYTWELAGQTYTLDAIEHDILRKLQEPRMHFAVNCASLSCPDLFPEPFSPQPDVLNTQLERATKAFLSNTSKGLRVDPDALRVSRIFRWYAEDFPAPPETATATNAYAGVLAFIRAYQEIPTNLPLRFLPYNWDLNAPKQLTRTN